MASTRRRLLLSAALVLGASAARAASFAEIRARASGQTVYFNHWGGSPEINDYIAWVAQEVRARFGIRLVSVKLSDTAEAVARVLAEKQAGKTSGGTVDLIWINGENFAAMKKNGLLFGPFVETLPNFALVDTVGKPTTLIDFTIPTEGYEAPWGMAQFVMLYDSARVPQPPRALPALRAWIERHPGRFTYPAPPDFIGSTFLKHLLYAAIDDPARLLAPPDPVRAEADTAGVWAWCDAVRPHLWRSGTTYPVNKEALHRLLDDAEVDFSMAFNPSEASNLILSGRLPPTVRSYVFETGTIANTHFLAIPFNASAKEGAMVVVDFLLSPEAQARKADERIWGDPTVLDLAKLSPEDRARFDALPRGPATLPPEALAPALPEPHPAWMELLEAAWLARYGRG
ncbi:MAG: ABC transporter substrate-binding protein [Geminicoccaceae bacterium]|nr:ABC transporter substrate-binding protein [Geminicoccaceae bacterium]